jgi:hypothetical protein
MISKSKVIGVRWLDGGVLYGKVTKIVIYKINDLGVRY